MTFLCKNLYSFFSTPLAFPLFTAHRDGCKKNITMRLLSLVPAIFAQLMAVTLTKTVNMTSYTAPFLGCVSLCFSDESLSVASSTISDNDSERKAAPVDVERDSNFKETSTLASSLVSTPPSPPETTERPLFFGPTPHFTDREHEYSEPQRLSNGFQNEAGSMTFVTGDQKSSQAIGTGIVESDTKAIEQPRPTGAATIEPTDPDKATNTEHFEDKRRIQSVLERLLGKSGSELSPPTPYTNSTSGPQTTFSSWNRTSGFISELSSVTFSVSTGEAYSTTSSSNLQPLSTEGGTVDSAKEGSTQTGNAASEDNKELYTTTVGSGKFPSEKVSFTSYPSATAPNQETNKQQTDQSNSREGEISSEFFEFPKSASLFSEYRPSDFVGSSEAARTTNSPWKHRAPGNNEGSESTFTNSLISSFFTVTVVTPAQGESSEPGAGSEHGAGSESTRSQSPEAEDTNVFSSTYPESTEGPLPGTYSSAIQNPRTSSSTSEPQTSAQTTESDTKPGENVSVYLPVSKTTSSPPPVSVPDGSNGLTTQTGLTDSRNGANNAKNGTTQGTLIYITSGTSNASAPFTFPHITLTKASTRNSTSTSPETSPNTASALLLPPRTRPPIKTQAGSVSGSAAQNQPWYRSLYIVVLGVVL